MEMKSVATTTKGGKTTKSWKLDGNVKLVSPNRCRTCSIPETGEVVLIKGRCLACEVSK